MAANAPSEVRAIYSIPVEENLVTYRILQYIIEQSFLWMTGPLSIGLGVLIGAGLGRMFFPASTLLQNVSIYGGMAVFGGLLLVDIQRVMHRIRFTPPASYDPINSSIGIYLDIVNLFTRILEYMALSKNNRR